MAGKKYPCGGCNKEVAKNGKALACSVCDFWFHFACVDGMTDQFYDNCTEAATTFGYSAFFCKCCRKATSKLNQEIKEMKERMGKLEERIEEMEGEKEAVVKRVGRVEKKAEKAKEDLEGVEREIKSGMGKAMAEAKKEVITELKQEEIRSARIAIYGLKESEKEDEGAEWKEEEKGKVEEMARVMGVELVGEVEVRFRAGRKGVGEEARPRPLIVRIADEETRAKVMRSSGKLSREEGWKKIFVAPDMTKEQREAARKEEMELREKADSQTKTAKEEKRNVQYRVVGQRGSRRIVEIPLRE